MTTVNNVNSGTTVNTTATTPATPSASATLNTNYQTFLKLLTTQIQHQDPLQPQDSSQFTNQLVLFSQVEQQINSNTTLSSILAAQQASTTGQSLGYLGLNVTANASNFDYTGNSVNLGYTLSAQSASTSLGIYDSNGNTVWQGTGSTATGAHQLTWDGTDSAGDPVESGVYTLKALALDSTGTAITSTTQVPGQVTGVTNASGATQVTVNGQQVAVSDIVSAALPTSGSGGSSTNTSTSN